MILAQVAADASKQLVEQGVLGAVVVALMVALAWLAVQWSKTHKSWIADKTKVAEAMIELTGGMKDALAGLGASIDKLKMASDEERRSLDDLRRSIDQLNNAMLLGLARRTTPSQTNEGE